MVFAESCEESKLYRAMQFTKTYVEVELPTLGSSIERV